MWFHLHEVSSQIETDIKYNGGCQGLEIRNNGKLLFYGCFISGRWKNFSRWMIVIVTQQHECT